MEISQEEMKGVNKELSKIEKKLKKVTSFKYNFSLSIVKGVGTVIGGTIVIALLYGVLSWILQRLGGFPYLQELLKR